MKKGANYENLIRQSQSEFESDNSRSKVTTNVMQKLTGKHAQ